MATIDVPAESSLPENVPAVPTIPSDGGRRPRFSWRGLWRAVFPAEVTSGEELWEERQRARLKASELPLKAEAELYAQVIPNELARLGICYRYKKSEKEFEQRVKKVSIRKPYILREEAIYLHVDTRPEYQPRDVRIRDLADPDVLTNLSIACHHKVLCKYSEVKGFYYIVEREIGIRGIPAHVKYDEILSGRPASLDPLALPFGIGENKRAIWKSLAQMQSLLVAGTTGGGKSNMLNVLICTLLRYNSKRRLRLLLVDLKGGVEFSYYADVPHLLPIILPPKEKGGQVRTAAIVEDRQDVVPAFKWLVTEGERRLGLLKGEHVKHVGEYNYKHQKNPIPHIVCIVDEWADVKLEPKLGREAEELLINIASRFRAAGIHLIICTQTPNKDVISIRVKNVLPARLAFACPNINSSILIIGNGRAAGLEPRGRAIFDWGHMQLELQAPLINNETVDEMVAASIRGQWEEIEIAIHDVTDQEIYEWAQSENNGDLAAVDIWRHFQRRGLAREYAEQFCKDAEGKTVVLSAGTFEVKPSSGRRPRKLIGVAEEPETPENQGESE